MTRHRFRAVVIMIATLALAASCVKEEKDSSSGPRRYEATREMMGTFVTITVWANTPQQGATAVDAAFEQIRQIELSMSDYNPDSELSKINREAYDHPVAVSDKMLDVLKTALLYAELSDGGFDISMRPLKRLWKSAGKSGEVPDDDTIKAVLASVGYRDIELDEQAKTVRFLKPAMELDLGAIAKGYSADLAVAELKRLGVPAALVNAGGNIAVMGTPPNVRAWRVGIQDPNKLDLRLQDVIHLTGGSVATSGDYERFVEIGGKRFSHIFDPRTGRPVEHMSSVTVIAPDGITSDALSTTLSVMGPDAGLALAAKLVGVDAMFIVAGPDGPTVIKSPGFDKYLQGE